MTWYDEYRKRVTTAERAVEHVCSGERVFLQGGLPTPVVLIDALHARISELRDVEMIEALAMRKAFTGPECAPYVKLNTFFAMGEMRKAVAEGRADYFPVIFSRVEELFSSRRIPLDVAMIQAAPPDAEGYLSMGIAVDMTLTAALSARKLLVEVNDQMPYTCGPHRLHVTQATAFVESSRPVLELPPVPVGELHRRIAEHIEPLIPDGATLQTGIGGVPDGVLACLAHKKDLGMHTEMFSDGAIPLIESGVINNQAKTINKGKLITSFVLGTKKIFDFVHQNPLIEFHPNRYVCDPYVIGQHDNMVAINSAMQVDFTGQVCSDSIGATIYSGFGGQLDFIRGAGRSKGGRPILALPATAKDGTISRIVPVLDPGSGVVVNRAEVGYIVTEFGVADLYGKTFRQRTEALIAIAHPDFRDQLYDAAVKLRYLEPRKSGARTS